MSISNSIKIAIMEIEGQLDKTASIEDRLKKAMKLAKNHWLIVDEDEQFKSAVGAVLLKASEEERQIINQEMRILGALSAAQAGIPVNIEAVLPDDVKKSYGLVKLWKETK